MPSGGKWRVSSEGGDSPIWRADGKELFFTSLDSKLMSVAIVPGTAFDAAAPTPLFKLPGDLLDVGVVTQYDVTVDGKSFLMNIETPTDGQRMITLVTNWTTLLK